MNTTDRVILIGCARTVCRVIRWSARAVAAAVIWSSGKDVDRRPAIDRMEAALQAAETSTDEGIRELPDPGTE